MAVQPAQQQHRQRQAQPPSAEGGSAERRAQQMANERRMLTGAPRGEKQAQSARERKHQAVMKGRRRHCVYRLRSRVQPYRCRLRDSWQPKQPPRGKQQRAVLHLRAFWSGRTARAARGPPSPQSSCLHGTAQQQQQPRQTCACQHGQASPAQHSPAAQHSSGTAQPSPAAAAAHSRVRAMLPQSKCKWVAGQRACMRACRPSVTVGEYLLLDGGRVRLHARRAVGVPLEHAQRGRTLCLHLRRRRGRDGRRSGAR